MVHTLKVDPDDKVLGWLIFIDHRPVVDFNRDMEAFLNLAPGPHRLFVNSWGRGSELKISIDGTATMTVPPGAWPLSIKVPQSKTGTDFLGEFTT